MEEQDDDLGEDLAVEVDHRRVGEDLVSDAGLRIGGDLQDVEIGLVLPNALNFDEAVRQPARLHEIGLKRSPGDDAAHAGQTKNGIGKVLDQPLAAFVVLVHRTSSARADQAGPAIRQGMTEDKSSVYRCTEAGSRSPYRLPDLVVRR
jgi:hypothetical protein